MPTDIASGGNFFCADIEYQFPESYNINALRVLKGFFYKEVTFYGYDSQTQCGGSNVTEI